METFAEQSEKNIFLAAPRGFCAGVRRAIRAVSCQLEKNTGNVYLLHDLVHNRAVNLQLEKQGVRRAETLAEIPENSIVAASAHGVSREFLQQLQQRNLKLLDATCPIVLSAQKRAADFRKKGETVVLIGHASHPETIGILGQAPGILPISTPKEAESLQLENASEQIHILTQSTLSNQDIAPILQTLEERFPGRIHRAGGICYATNHRQAAVKLLCQTCEAVLVIGSPASSNSNRLQELARSQGKTAFLIDSIRELTPADLQYFSNIGITAGASAPEELVQQAIEQLQQWFCIKSIQTVSAAEESGEFPLPELPE